MVSKNDEKSKAETADSGHEDPEVESEKLTVSGKPTEDEERKAESDKPTEDEVEKSDEGKKPSDDVTISREAEETVKSSGVLALFDEPNATLEAARRARDTGFEKWDVYTPFPVHGMDEAMGLGRSPVPWITFVMGVVGLCAAIIIQFGTMVYSWPMNYGGKPYAAWPSFVPISFEMTVFMAGVSTAIGALLLGGIFKFRKRVPHRHVTSHRFAIFVEASDPKYDEVKMLSLFQDVGAIDVRVVKEGER